MASNAVSNPKDNHVKTASENQNAVENNSTKTVEGQSNVFLMFSYAVIVGLWVIAQIVNVPYVANLLLLVTAILYAACHQSLVLLEDQARLREYNDNKDGSNEGKAPPPRVDTLGKEEAMQFPLVGSATLFSLYLAFKFLNPETVNVVIAVYFCLMGCAALTVTFLPLFTSLSPENVKDITVNKEIKIKHPFPEFIAGESPWDLSIDAKGPELLSLGASFIFCVCYFKSKHWALNNVLGISFCLQGIERFSLGTYKIGAILLVGLFFYDIFWVFGTEVMVTVAKSLDGPIKILFPRSLTPDPVTNKIQSSLLGLGDIVIPGFFLALLLRFDAYNAKVPALPIDIHAKFPKPYFHSALFAYVLGLGFTMFVMIYFEAAQPALLYLVPACLGSSLLCAVVRGELENLFAYSEEDEEAENENTDSKKDD